MAKQSGQRTAARRAGPGRPSKYDPAYCELATKYCLLGATDAEMAEFFEVTESTLNLWKQQHPEFSESIKKGKEIADATVAESLYKRANGYKHPDTHISNFQGVITATPITKEYAPDTAAAIFWLKNRRRQNWRDKQDHELTGKDGGPIETVVTDRELARRVAFVLTRGAKKTK